MIFLVLQNDNEQQQLFKCQCIEETMLEVVPDTFDCADALAAFYFNFDQVKEGEATGSLNIVEMKLGQIKRRDK